MIFRRLAIVMIVLLAAACGGLTAESDWTMSRYDDLLSGYTPEKLGVPLTMSWQYNTKSFPDNPSSPAIVGGVAYFASSNRVYAVDATTGTLKWRYPEAEAPLNCDIRTGIAAGEGKIFFGGTDGLLYAVSMADGRISWTFPTRGSIRCSPVISDGVVYFGSTDNSLYAVNAETGESVWAGGFRTRDDVNASPAVTSGVVVFASMDANIYAASTATGKTRWTYRLPMSPVRSGPVVSSNMVYVPAGRHVYALSSKGGQLRYVINMESDVAAPPAVSGNDLYVLCRNRKLYAFSAGMNGYKMKWEAPASLGLTATAPPIISGDTIFVGSNKGMISAFSTDDGSLVWRYTIAPSIIGNNNKTTDFTNVSAPLAVANGSLFALTDDGSLHCFKPGAPDNTPPKPFNAMPTPGVIIPGSPPIKVSVILYDESSGVDENSIDLLLDGEKVECTYDPETLTVSYSTPTRQPIVPLKDGRHTVSVTAMDWRGNALDYSWAFTVDNRLAPPTLPRTSRDQQPATPRTDRRQPQPEAPQAPAVNPNDMPPPPPPAPGGETGGGDGPPGAPPAPGIDIPGDIEVAPPDIR